MILNQSKQASGAMNIRQSRNRKNCVSDLELGANAKEFVNDKWKIANSKLRINWKWQWQTQAQTHNICPRCLMFVGGGQINLYTKSTKLNLTLDNN